MSVAFEQLVKECRSRKIDRTIYNASRGHAHVLLRNLFETAHENNAKDAIKIVSGDLDSVFYGSLGQAVCDASTNGCEVSILVMNPKSDLDNNPFIRALKDKPGITCIQYKGPGIKLAPHFVLVGKNKYRFEVDHTEAKAEANFNDPVFGGFLNALYKEIEVSILPAAKKII
ncbi:MAG: hypothetical protein HQK85_03160 [Nitrospinae bacterium]|nr:hypothetical protein [Nitrospinota bacterium]